MSGTGCQSRVQYQLHLRTRRQPARNGQGRRSNRLQAYRQRLHASQCEAAIVGRCRAAEKLLGRAQLSIDGLVPDRNRAQQQVAMSANVLGERLHGYIDAVCESVKVHARRPGIVQHYQRSSLMRCFRDRRDILDLHGDGARALAPDQPRVRLNQAGDATADGRRIVGDLRAETPQYIVGQFAIRTVNAFRHQNVVAALEKGKVDQRDGTLAAGRDDGAIALLQFADALG